MIRVWSEHLPFHELRAPATTRLLRANHVHPIFAVRPDASFAEVASTIRSFRDIELECGIWPLLSADAGYWPSERNARPWAEYVERLVGVLAEKDVLPAWVAVDLEPPLNQASRLLRRTYDIPLVAARFARDNMDVERYAAAERTFAAALARLRARGIRTLGITLPLAAHDLRDDAPFWQDMFETPWSNLDWDSAGIMAYGSIIAGASYGTLRPRDARDLHQRLLRHVAGHFGPRAHASIGVTGTGVFGDEPAWDHPDELRLDASAARAAGIEDIGVYCLEGILAQTAPEVWLRAVTEAPSRAPRPTVRASAIASAGLIARRAGRLVFGR